MSIDLIPEIRAISDEFFEKSQELADLAEKSGTAWLELKAKLEDSKNGKVTNAEVDKHFDTTEIGRRTNYLKIYLKGLEKKRGALVLEHKSHMPNQY